MNRQDFHILTEQVHGRPLIYLDNAATTQKPHQVVEAICYAYEHFNANIHRGVHHLSQVATAAHEEARRKVAAHIGARSEKEIIFTKGTTDSINTLAFSLGEMLNSSCKENMDESGEIIVSALEHHSNIVPWQMLCERKGFTLRVVPLKDDLTLDMDAYASMLSDRVKLVSIAHVSNVLGIINPVKDIVRLAHEAGALVHIDAAQSAPHLPLNVQDIDCDFLSLSAHKMYGPTGLGVLYGKEALLEKLPPCEGGGEMIDHVRWEHTTYNVLPYKFEAGTPNYIGSYAFGAAIDYLHEVEKEQSVHAYEADLTTYAEEQLRALSDSLSFLTKGEQGGLRIHIYADGQQKAGAISFNCFNGTTLIHPYDIGMLLDQQGVAVRTGHHCAEPLIDHLGVPGTVRVSFALYNDRSDIDTFIAALRRALMMLM